MSVEDRLGRLEKQLTEILGLLKSKLDISHGEQLAVPQKRPIPGDNESHYEVARLGPEWREGMNIFSFAELDEEYGIAGKTEKWAHKHENEISHAIIGCAIEVHKELGPGLLESVYEDAMCYELNQAGLGYERQQRVPIRYKKIILSTPLKLDLIVEGKVIVDNKAKQNVTPIDKQALLTYLRLRNVHLGLIVNFHELKLVDGVQRIVNNLSEPS